MKRVVLILPYFGTLPDIFPLYLRSVQFNPTIDFILVTDCKITSKLPDNIKLISESFESFVGRFKEKLGQDIVLETPYKLCDYKPTFGYVLSEYIKEYDYWGYCDCDLIWGDIRKFIDLPMEMAYDKVLTCGHLCLIRNNSDNNSLFFCGKGAAEVFKNASHSNSPHWFDEDYLGKCNIHRIFLANNKKVYCEDYSITPCIDTDGFTLSKYDSTQMRFINVPNHGERYYWEQGKIFQVRKTKNGITKKEYAYMHFQQRHMVGVEDVLHEQVFRIVPNRFLKCVKIPENKREWNQDRKIYFSGQRFHQLKKRILKKLQRCTK